jgi:hypothetical protein
MPNILPLVAKVLWALDRLRDSPRVTVDNRDKRGHPSPDDRVLRTLVRFPKSIKTKKLLGCDHNSQSGAPGSSHQPRSLRADEISSLPCEIDPSFRAASHFFPLCQPPRCAAYGSPPSLACHPEVITTPRSHTAFPVRSPSVADAKNGIPCGYSFLCKRRSENRLRHAVRAGDAAEEK